MKNYLEKRKSPQLYNSLARISKRATKRLNKAIFSPVYQIFGEMNMKKKNRRRLALLILIITFTAMPASYKLLCIAPMAVCLFIDWDEFYFEQGKGDVKA